VSDAAAVTGAIELSVSAHSDPGRTRTENQDHFLVADLTVREGGLLLEPDAEPGNAAAVRVRPGARGLLAMVADGMGGAAGGRIASHFAVAWTYRELQARLDAGAPPGPDGTVGCLRAAIEAANTRVHEQGERTPEYAGMGSTVTAVVVLGTAYFAAQVGDSRAYVVRAGAAHRLTRDQSLVQKLVDAGAMTPEEALRSPHGSVLLQALGTAASVAVELTWMPARRGDLLLLCSDGLYRMVPDDEIAAAAAALQDPDTLCRSLVEVANARGGPDNVTVVAARVDGDALPLPSADEVSVPQPYIPAGS
jgi:protein phosphatase